MKQIQEHLQMADWNSDDQVTIGEKNVSFEGREEMALDEIK